MTSYAKTLGALARNLSRYGELAPEINSWTMVRAVGGKLLLAGMPGCWVVLAEDGESIDVDLSLDHLNWLIQPGTVPQATFRGRRVVDLETACTATQTPFLHPIYRQEQLGPDDVGNDLTVVDGNVIVAVAYAGAIGHRLVQGLMADPYRFGLLILAFDSARKAGVDEDQLDPRMVRIMDLYARARANNGGVELFSHLAVKTTMDAIARLEAEHRTSGTAAPTSTRIERPGWGTIVLGPGNGPTQIGDNNTMTNHF